METSYKKTAEAIYKLNSSDMSVIQEIMSGMPVRSYEKATKFYESVLTPITGFDGFETQWNDSSGSTSNIYLAFNTNQIKSVENGGQFSSWDNNIYKSKKDAANSGTTGYNKNTDQYRVMWTIEEGVMNDFEVSQFYDLVGEVKRGMKFPKTFDGETIFEIENKIVYVDTDYFYPSILKVVEFSDADIEHISYYMEVIEDYEQQGIKSEEYIEIIEAMSGQGTVTSTDFVDSKAYRREKNGKGKGSGSGTSNSRSGKNVLKSKPDTAPDESIAPPKIRKTAQKTQAAFKLKEEVQKNLNSRRKSSAKHSKTRQKEKEKTV